MEDIVYRARRLHARFALDHTRDIRQHSSKRARRRLRRVASQTRHCDRPAGDIRGKR